MKTDRELLELAGLAAGMHVLRDGEVWPDEQVGWFFCQVGDQPPGLYDRATNAATKWRPLTDKRDALGLAISLRLSIAFTLGDTPIPWGTVMVGYAPWKNETPIATHRYDDATGKEYATCRAIVSAAARIQLAKERA